jgi:hypothetical protein
MNLLETRDDQPFAPFCLMEIGENRDIAISKQKLAQRRKKPTSTDLSLSEHKEKK